MYIIQRTLPNSHTVYYMHTRPSDAQHMWITNPGNAMKFATRGLANLRLFLMYPAGSGIATALRCEVVRYTNTA
jgi:hypothetical protein